MKMIMISLIGFIVFLLLLSFLGFYFAIHPLKIMSSMTPDHFNIPYETVIFRTQDGVSLHGWYISAKRVTEKTIILLHGYPADKGDILPSRLFLHKKYNLFLFDFRYFGKSGGTYSTAGKKEVLDLLAAIQYLHSRGIHEVGIWGFSMGGAVALMTAAKAPQIKALVVESAYSRLDWIAIDYYKIPLLKYPLAQLTRFWAWLFLGYDINQVSPALSVKTITKPILLIYSKQDEVIPIQHGLLMQQSLQHNPHAQFIFVDDTLHGQFIENNQLVVEQFFSKNL